MIEILSVVPNGDRYYGYVRIRGNYYKFQTDSSEVKITPFKGEFRNLQHFAGVVGKFNPWHFFMKKPVLVEELDLEVLSALNINMRSASI